MGGSRSSAATTTTTQTTQNTTNQAFDQRVAAADSGVALGPSASFSISQVDNVPDELLQGVGDLLRGQQALTSQSLATVASSRGVDAAQLESQQQVLFIAVAGVALLAFIFASNK